jgi:hypothetical protein
MRVPLVDAERQCQSPTNVHHPPLALPNCVPNSPESLWLRTGNTGTASGFAAYKVINPSTPSVDITVQVFTADVRCVTGAIAGCVNGPNSDFTGDMFLRTPIRLTDHTQPGTPTGIPCGNPAGTPPCSPDTVTDFNYDIPMASCIQTGPPTQPGSNCSVTTTFNTGFPGVVINATRTTWRNFDEVVLMDPGADGAVSAPSCPPFCGTGDETVFQAQGLFTP